MDSLTFLQNFHPNTFWVLTAIAPDRKGIETVTFTENTAEECKKWLEANNGKRNIYFSVNQPLYALSKKANREDIREVNYFHVDIDPQEGKELNAERDRLLALFYENRPKNIPEPTCIIFSGGGYQGFWKLEKPIPINGDIGLAEDAKRYNMQLEQMFGGDNCHNIDRIMRLPGTINIPDAKKRKKGRTETESYVVEYQIERVYDTKKFSQAQGVQIHGDHFSGGVNQKQIKISGNVSRLTDINDLDEWDVPDRLKVVVVQGRDPDNPKEGDNSRSAWVFDCVCNLVRFGVPDEVIFGIITDPEFGISESILEQKGNVERYALRQIERAKEWVVDPWLLKLNEQFAVIGNMGGKCRIIEEVLDSGLNRTRLTKQSFEDFRNRFSHCMVQIGETADGTPKFTSVGKWWLGHAQRRQYDFMGFLPGETVPNLYNLWRGFAFAAIPGEHEPFLDHIFRNICKRNEELYNYVINWMARCVQNPATPGQVALVLRGGRGSGKSFFAKHFGALFGRHFLHISNSGHLVGNFNSHLRDCVVLFADEAFYANDRRHTSILKTLITEETIPIESKGVDVETAPNYIHLIMASNDLHVIPAGGDERRFLVLDVGNENQQDSKYFKNLAKLLKAGGYEALLHYLSTIDLSEFDVSKVPQTDALREQKLLSLSVEEEWWYQKLCRGNILDDDENWKTEIPKDYLVEDYINNAKKFNITRRGSATSLGKQLSKLVPSLDHKQILTDIKVHTPDGFYVYQKKRMYHYIVPTLAECRAHWDKMFGKEKWETYNF